MRIQDYCTFAAALAVLASCGAKPKGKPDAAMQAPEPEPKVLALPEVPSSLTDAKARADYATLHFWDALDFADHKLSLDTAFMEQNFSNYLALMSIASDKAVTTSVGNVMSRAADNGHEAFGLLRYLSDKYLGDPNSPMRDNERYIAFLQATSKCNLLDKDDSLRVDYRLQQAMKNRRGTTASDFPINLRGGNHSTLHRECRKASTTLLVFYDPDCKHCKAVIGELANAPLRHGVQVLAVDFTGNRDLWQRTASAMPPQWSVGFAAIDIEGKELYTLPASPTLYILGHNAKVVAKDPDYRLAMRMLE